MDCAGAIKAAGLVTCLAGLGLTVRSLGGTLMRPPRGALAVAASASADGPAARADADSLAGVIVRRDPFRLTRAPASVPFNPEAPASMVAASPPRPPRPTFALVGLVLGVERAALIDGLPGVEGTRVMRVGERVGEYVLRAIGAESVVIVGPDTVWTLRVRSQFP